MQLSNHNASFNNVHRTIDLEEGTVSIEKMSPCPCCSGPLLRHIGHGSIYWFCSSCRQEMPNFS